ncbi:helix-turn-helix transcriptional regulator [uncultured Campylobacter sp.]|jgi:bacteriophage CI repressor helix-turn-helix domain|uniref:helix-turn-helix domain-containing protein n=1 Tax=uncultured Campylobacter sp. TaxID=218934 RepID=UPI00206CB587|nr:helix-turn-helix transcriptional regulator [uncultured Campylobacter sp.]DAJ95828.1 MAG TPA: helix-turn-helix domain protein [Caudoviricetes sp.]
MKPKPSDYIALSEVGDRLEGIRLIFGLDMVAMCEMLCTTKYFFNEVKRGRKLIPYEWVIKLAEKYDLNQNWIYQGQGEIFNKRKNDV